MISPVRPFSINNSTKSTTLAPNASTLFIYLITAQKKRVSLISRNNRASDRWRCKRVAKKNFVSTFIDPQRRLSLNYAPASLNPPNARQVGCLFPLPTPAHFRARTSLSFIDAPIRRSLTLCTCVRARVRACAFGWVAEWVGGCGQCKGSSFIECMHLRLPAFSRIIPARLREAAFDEFDVEGMPMRPSAHDPHLCLTSHAAVAILLNQQIIL